MKEVELKKELMLGHDTLWSSEEPVDIKQLLIDIPMLPAIEQIAYLLHRLISRKKEPFDFHAQELTMWMMQLTGDTQRRTLEFVTGQDVFNMQGFTLTNRRVCLSLMQELLKCSSVAGDTLTKEQQGKLFKALLYFNSKYLKTQEKLFNWDGSGDENFFLNIVLPTKINNLGISKLRDYQVQLMKAFYFFEFCSTDAEYQPYLDVFLQFYKLTSYKEYLNNILHLNLKIMTGEEQTCKFVVNPEIKGIIDFLDQFAINGKEINTEDFKTLREYPIFKSTDDTYVILFNNFFVDKFYQSFLFDFIAILNKAGYDTVNFGKLRNDMGNRFSEHFMFYRAMNNCFCNYGNARKSGEELKQLLEVGEPDYYIRHGRKLFLFEFKDVLLRADKKNSESADIIRDELTEKLEESKSNRKKNQNKALKQLFNSIETILSGKYQEKGIDEFDTSTVMIYPILVHTDVALEAEGVNFFLKERLNTMISEKKLQKHRIKDLVVINIDMLISIQDLFKDKKIVLANCLNDFIAYSNIGSSPSRMMPFDEFLKYDLFKKKLSFLTAPNEFRTIVHSLTSNA